MFQSTRHYSHHTDPKHFSFSELERRIAALPEGPVEVLNRPRWQYWLDIAGGLAMIVGLLPGLFIQFFEPKQWMVTMTQYGVWATAGFFLPGFIHNIWSFMRLAWSGKRGDAAQLDHDYAALSDLQPWLATFPQHMLEQHLRFIQAAQARMAAKLSLMGGGLDRFGVLPAILAVTVQIRMATTEKLDFPLWQTVPALFFAILYLIGLNAAFMRVRMSLYEAVLAESLQRRIQTVRPDLAPTDSINRRADKK
jgi:hypothetical protein